MARLGRAVAGRWFDTTAFEANRAPNGTLLAGDAGRNIMRPNIPHFAMSVLATSDPAFGRITHTRNPTNLGSTATSFANRMIQFALKLEF